MSANCLPRFVNSDRGHTSAGMLRALLAGPLSGTKPHCPETWHRRTSGSPTEARALNRPHGTCPWFAACSRLPADLPPARNTGKRPDLQILPDFSCFYLILTVTPALRRHVHLALVRHNDHPLFTILSDLGQHIKGFPDGITSNSYLT